MPKRVKGSALSLAAVTARFAESKSLIDEWSREEHEWGETFRETAPEKHLFMIATHRRISGVDQALADLERAREFIEHGQLVPVDYLLSRAEDRFYQHHYGCSKAAYVLAQTGKRFTEGRKPGAGSPIRKAIARFLKTDPALKNADLWRMLESSPPRGWKLRDNRSGRYAEGPKAENMNYERFCNVAAEERRKLTA